MHEIFALPWPSDSPFGFGPCFLLCLYPFRESSSTGTIYWPFGRLNSTTSCHRLTNPHIHLNRNQTGTMMGGCMLRPNNDAALPRHTK